MCELVAGERANIVQIEHRREGVQLAVGDVGLDLTVVMRNEEHCRRLIAALEAERLPRGAAQLMDGDASSSRRSPDRADPERLVGVDSSYLFDIAGEGRWLVEVRDQKVTVTEDPDRGGDVAFSMSGETFDKIPVAEAEPDDRLHDRAS